ncbi:hypothetical protein NQ318_023046 [Aromia moschata]|uniref:HMG box domain-containing protein n=1 Tax=Aromia moschata TaxID=1265417 RepID=A0AAV8XWV3_9CUCU|nr:hypothetical protein NQ318_023046 [Aromia moschata]
MTYAYVIGAGAREYNNDAIQQQLYVAANIHLLARIASVNVQLSVMGLKQDTRERLQQLKIPEKPKRPLSPYMKFIAEHRESLSKKCAEEWKNVSKEVKSKYTESYNLEREAYEVKFLRFNEALTPEQKEAVKYIEEEKKEDKKKRKLRKLYKETNKPKRPMGPFMHYLVEQGKVRNKPIKDLMSELSETWSKMPEGEKQKYRNLFLKEKEKYEQALVEWESQMLKEGRDDLVRAKTLGEKRPSRIRQLKKDNPQ